MHGMASRNGSVQSGQRFMKSQLISIKMHKQTRWRHRQSSIWDMFVICTAAGGEHRPSSFHANQHIIKLWDHIDWKDYFPRQKVCLSFFNYNCSFWHDCSTPSLCHGKWNNKDNKEFVRYSSQKICRGTVTTRTKKYEKPPQRKLDKMNVNFMTCMIINCVNFVVTQNHSLVRLSVL